MRSLGTAAIPPHTAQPGGEEGWLLYISVYTDHASTGVCYPDIVQTLGLLCSSVLSPQQATCAGPGKVRFSLN